MTYYNMARAGQLWDRYVGNESPRDFMGPSKGMSARESVAEYLTHLDSMFGEGTAKDAPEDLEDALTAYIEDQVVEMYGRWVYYNAAENMMDDEIREELHNELAPCTNQEFMDAYLARHLTKYQEQFKI